MRILGLAFGQTVGNYFKTKPSNAIGLGVRGTSARWGKHICFAIHFAPERFFLGAVSVPDKIQVKTGAAAVNKVGGTASTIHP